MTRREERRKGWKDFFQKNRNMVAYVMALLALLMAMVGWGLLPDMVSINPEIDGAYFRPKGQMVLMHLGMTGLFTGLFWKWPRELGYLFGAVVSLGLTLLMLYANLGV